MAPVRLFHDDVRCTGSEKRLVDCPRLAYGHNNCATTEAVTLTCQASTATLSTTQAMPQPQPAPTPTPTPTSTPLVSSSTSSSFDESDRRLAEGTREIVLV